MRSLAALWLVLGTTACGQLLGIESGQVAEPSDDGGATGSGGRGGSGPVCAPRVDLEGADDIDPGLTQPRSIRADAVNAFFTGIGTDRWAVQFFNHNGDEPPTMTKLGDADGPTHTIDHLHLTFDYAAWVSRGGNISRLVTKRKDATNDPQGLQDLSDPASSTPVASDGSTLLWVTQVADSGLELFTSGPPHGDLTNAPGIFEVASDRSLVARDGAVFIASVDGIMRYAVSTGMSGPFSLGETAPQNLFTTSTHLYWSADDAIRRKAYEADAVVETVATLDGPVLGFDIRSDCVVAFDDEGNIALVPAGGGAAEPLTRIAGVNSLVTTADHILLTTQDDIRRIPWDTTQ